jgi:hypothetical protein
MGVPVEHVVEQRPRHRTHEGRCDEKRRRPQPVLAQPVGGDAMDGKQRQDADDQERATARVQRPQREEQNAERSESEKRGADRRLHDQRMDQDERQQDGQQRAAAIAAQKGDTAQQPPPQPCSHLHSASSTVMPSGPSRNTSLRSWKLIG